MKNFYEAFKTETNLEIDGVWKEYANGLVRVKLSRQGGKNISFNKQISEVAKKYENISNETKEDIDLPWAEIYATCIIKGFEVKEDGAWVSGVYLPNEEGELVREEANAENIKKVLIDLPDLFDTLKDDANDIRTFQKEIEESDSKN